MATATRRKRTKSTFKKQSGSHLQLGLRPSTDAEGKKVLIPRQVGGYGYLNNRCKCRNCKDSRGAF